MMQPRSLGSPFSTIVLILLCLARGAALSAQEAEAPEPPDWSFELGLSYLATTGNSETSSGGVKALWNKDWDPWSLEARAFFLRAEDRDETTAERYGASLEGSRALSEHWDLTAGWGAEKDRFSGIDLRHVVDAGATWHMVAEKRWTLDSRYSLTWTSEELGGGQPSNDYLGALVGLDAKWILSENAEAFSKLVYFPNFDEGEDYRFEGTVGLTANLNRRLAVQLGSEVRYDNRPVPGFEKTDTATTASLVMKLPSLAEE
jgi:putative salt-induced outer membrane protein